MIALLAGCAGTPATSTSTGAKPGAAPTMAATADSPEAALQTGMTPDAVKAIMGTPVEIRPMKLEPGAGKAEIWIYRRSTAVSTTQVQIGSKSTPIAWTSVTTGQTGSTGASVVTQTVEEPIYKQQTEYDDETISLLMYNGSFQKLNRTVQKRRTFD
jgi:hypothetical protein